MFESNDNDTAMDRGRSRRLARLDELDGFKVADGDIDPRGWEVKASDNRKVGEVDSLIVDTAALKVRYLDVKLDRKALDLDDDRHVLVPIGGARLDDDRDDVLLGSMTRADLVALPPYQHGTLTREDEIGMHRRFDRGRPATRTDRDLYEHDHYDQNRFFGKRRAGRENEQYLTRSEEELTVGKRQVQAGEVGVRKTIETEHVTEQVPVTREEVTIERRPLTGAAATRGDLEIGEDEVTVPLMAEEVVAEKRAVAKEEVVIGKKAIAEQKTVEADLKKERVEVDRDATRAGRGSARDHR